nr:exo-alpha-sialidase [Methylotenera sp.]
MKIKLFLCTCLLLLTANTHSHEGHTSTSKSGMAISVALDATGALWRASVKDDFVQVDVSRDLGKTFSKPILVNLQPQKIGADGEARPKLAIGPEGNIYVTWTESLKAPFSGYIWFARSINQGKSFEKPFIVHQDRAEITHRFEALNVAQSGENKGNVTVA